MSRRFHPRVLAGMALLLVGGVIGFWRFAGSGPDADAPFEPALHLAEPAPLCPWRNPDADTTHFFPAANRREAVTLILSGRRVELARELGRPPTAEENSLRLHRLFHDQTAEGAILLRRVKGQHGAIEVVLAVSAGGTVRGVKIQDQREPAEIATAVSDPRWLDRFKGRGKDDAWPAPADLDDLPGSALPSANAIAEGVHRLLVLLAVAERSSPRQERHPSHS